MGAYISGAAVAADIAPMPTKAPVAPAPVLSPWTYSATSYGWVPLLNGSTTVKGRTIDVDVGFSELRILYAVQKSRKISLHSWDISRRAMAAFRFSPTWST